MRSFDPSALQVPTAYQTASAAVDFDQWVAEIRSFVNETSAELHELAGLLAHALSDESELPPRGSAGAAPRGGRDKEAKISLNNPAGVLDDPLTSLQSRLARRILERSQTQRPAAPEEPGAAPAAEIKPSTEW